VNDQPPILDQAVVSELRESVGGDDGFVKELVGAYLAESPGYLEQMTAAAAADDVAGVVRPAHTLKSSSAALGAMRLAELSKQVEHAAREGRIEHDAIAAARSLWSDTVAALAAAGMSD
jgi:HPt (histidine-containing phosphotransfer) domain-containing protein